MTEEARLVERSRRGDGEAFGDLVRRHATTIARLIRYQSDGEADRQDILQNTLLLAWLNIDKLRDAGRFRAWVLRIAANDRRFPVKLRSVALDFLGDLENLMPVQFHIHLNPLQGSPACSTGKNVPIPLPGKAAAKGYPSPKPPVYTAPGRLCSAILRGPRRERPGPKDRPEHTCGPRAGTSKTCLPKPGTAKGIFFEKFWIGSLAKR